MQENTKQATTADLDLRWVVEDLLADLLRRARALEKDHERARHDELIEHLRIVRKAIRGWRNVPPHPAQTKACFELLLEIAERNGWSPDSANAWRSEEG